MRLNQWEIEMDYNRSVLGQFGAAAVKRRRRKRAQQAVIRGFLIVLFIVLFLMIAVCEHARGQGLPDAPSASPSLTKADKVMLIGLTGLNGADAYFTHRNVGEWGRPEENPLARPFVTHGTGLTSAYFTLVTVMDWWGMRELKKHNHPKIARGITIGMIGVEVFCVARAAPGPRKRDLTGQGGEGAGIPWRVYPR